MASVEQGAPTQSNGGVESARIAVENPATGEMIATIPVLGPEQVEAMAARARKAQPAWDALGFGGRGQVLRRAQRGCSTTPRE